MDLLFLNDNISDIDKKNKLIKLKWQYLNNLRHLEIIIKEYEYKLEKECKHIFITKREEGPYGELWDTCKLCGYTRRH
tara:strand:- start:258 stop:491 length:234 start_codon:yes stop_codon:yes gene_type:complete